MYIENKGYKCIFFLIFQNILIYFVCFHNKYYLCSIILCISLSKRHTFFLLPLTPQTHIFPARQNAKEDASNAYVLYLPLPGQ